MRCSAAALFAMVALTTGCDRHREEKLGEEKPSQAARPIAETQLRLVVNGNALVPKTAIAETRGGETVYVTLSTAERTCADLSGNMIHLQKGEVVVHLDLVRPLFEEDEHGKRRAPASPPWRVTRASWPGGLGGLHASNTAPAPIAGVVEPPPDLAAKGGRLKIRYDAEWQVGEAAPRATLGVDGVVDVRGCGDHPEQPPKAPLPIDVRAGARAIPIRSAQIVQERGRARLRLAALPRACSKQGSRSMDGDIDLEIFVDGSQTSASGDLLPTQLAGQPSGYVVRLDGPVQGTDPVKVTVEGDGTEFLPLRIHGQVVAERCPD